MCVKPLQSPQAPSPSMWQQALPGTKASVLACDFIEFVLKKEQPQRAAPFCLFVAVCVHTQDTLFQVTKARLLHTIPCRKNKYRRHTRRREIRTGSKACVLQGAGLPLAQRYCWPFCVWKSSVPSALQIKKATSAAFVRKKGSSTQHHTAQPSNGQRLLLRMCTHTPQSRVASPRVEHVSNTRPKSKSSPHLLLRWCTGKSCPLPCRKRTNGQNSRKGEKRTTLLAGREVRATVGDEALLEASAEDLMSLHMWI